MKYHKKTALTRHIIPVLVILCLSFITTFTTVTNADNLRGTVHLSFDSTTKVAQWLAAGSIFSHDPSTSIKTTSTQVKTGDQALLASGKIAAGQYSGISFNLKMADIANRTFINFSNKLLSISVFVPKGSPVDFLAIGMWHYHNYVVIGSKPVEQGVWNDLTFNINYIYTYKLWEYTHTWHNEDRDLSVAEAQQVISECSFVDIKGQRNSAGSAQSTLFYVDDLIWADIDSSRDPIKITRNAAEESLRKYADQRKLKLGAAVNSLNLLYDEQFLHFLATEYNCIVPEFELQWKVLQPAEGVFDFSRADLLLAAASKNNMHVRGHTLLWHAGFVPEFGFTLFLPQWLEQKSYSELQGYLVRYIENVVTYYKGKIFAWDVCNEVIKDNGSGLRNNKENRKSYDYSIWSNSLTDDSLLKTAFYTARRCDPQAKLFLNDYNTEEKGKTKADKFYELVAKWVKEGVPIDGVGFQLHISAEQPIDFNKFRATLDRFVKLGLEIHFTEVDVRVRVNDVNINTAAGKNKLDKRLKKQAEVYAELLKIALDYEKVTAFLTWGLTDRYSWIMNNPHFPGHGAALLLDKDFNKKPAYYTFLDMLKTYK
ncbi:MAG: endo-1,4-beta-xylanase [Spirochaetales bacterium]|nr:endo-1,4-beta-xylanase [Spirochaetales bacterium]